MTKLNVDKWKSSNAGKSPRGFGRWAVAVSPAAEPMFVECMFSELKRHLAPGTWFLLP